MQDDPGVKHGQPQHASAGTVAMADPRRAERDELALVLFSRMLSRRPVWVDSPAGQMTGISMLALDDDGECIAYDHEGNDRRCENYLLTPPLGRALG